MDTDYRMTLDTDSRRNKKTKKLEEDWEKKTGIIVMYFLWWTVTISYGDDGERGRGKEKLRQKERETTQ